MKKIIFLLAMTISLIAGAQESGKWNIKYNKLQLLSTSTEDPEKNIIRLKLSELTSKKILAITYREPGSAATATKWKRTIGLYTTGDQELLRKNASVVNLSGSQLKKIVQENKTVKVYTWSLPKDAAEAARVRIRRVHLCTIELI